MPIVVVTGRQRAGKTSLVTYLGYKDFKEHDKQIFTNYNVGFPHERIHIDQMLNVDDDTIQNATVLIDEGHIFFDSRSSQTKRNKAIGYMAAQSGKRAIDFYITTHFFRQIDVRLRQHIDAIIDCLGVRHGIAYIDLWDRGLRKHRRGVVEIKPIWSLFDTHERVGLKSMLPPVPVLSTIDVPLER